MTYTILRNGNPREVWNWRVGIFAWDLDGDYDDAEWNYKHLRSAQRMQRKLRIRYPNADIDIFTTEEADAKRERLWEEEKEQR